MEVAGSLSSVMCGARFNWIEEFFRSWPFGELRAKWDYKVEFYYNYRPVTADWCWWDQRIAVLIAQLATDSLSWTPLAVCRYGTGR